ncbi:DUF2887 domain-containing protein [Tolypothrix campylonemoides VB511288_2]|uniref:DUF2887 domain-containing protein n=2 Tax=Nostocales TaxID=1161 RepID=A0ABW8WS90_9CYAN
MYLNRNRFQYDDWFCVVIFPSRSLEPSDRKTHRMFLNSDQVQRIYRSGVRRSKPAACRHQLDAVDDCAR